MGFLSSSGSSTSKTTTEPWKKAQPFLEKGFSFGGKLLDNSAKYPQAYAGPRVAGFSAPSQQGLNALVSTAQQGNPLAGNAVGALNTITGNLGITHPMLQATEGVNAVATGQIGADAIGSNLAGIASGAEGGIDPYTMQAVTAAQDSAVNRAKAALSRNGRYGANKAFANQVTAAATNAAAPVLAQAAQQQRQNQMQAAGMLSGEQLSNIGNMANAGNSLAEMFAGGQTRALQGGGIAGSVNDLRYADAQRLMAAGSAYDSQQQNVLNAARQQYEENRDIPWQQFGQYGATIGGVAQPYGQKTVTEPGQSPVMSAMSGAMSGAGMFGWPGAIAGAGLGLFGAYN